MQTSISCANHAVLHAQNDRWGLEPIETCNSDSKRCFACKNHRCGLGPLETSNSNANHVVLHAKNHRWGRGPIETCNSDSKVDILHTKTTDEGWDPYRLIILMLITLFCTHKTTGEVWDSRRLVFLALITLFCMQKPQMRARSHRE